MKNGRKNLVLFIVSLFLLNACGNSIKTKDLPAPPNSSGMSSVIEAGPKLDASEQKLFIFFKGNDYKDFDSTVRKLDISANSAEVFGFYDETLKQKGFVKDTAPNMPEGAEAAAWKKSEMFNEQIVIAVVFESRRVESNELTGKYLLLYTARK